MTKEYFVIIFKRQNNILSFDRLDRKTDEQTWTGRSTKTNTGRKTQTDRHRKTNRKRWEDTENTDKHSHDT